MADSGLTVALKFRADGTAEVVSATKAVASAVDGAGEAAREAAADHLSLTRALQAAGANDREAAAAAIRERDALAALCDRLDPTSAGLRRVAEDQARLTAAVGAGSINPARYEQLNQSLERVADAHRKEADGSAAAERAAAAAAEAARRERDALTTLCDRLDPTSAGLRRVAEDQARLKSALDAGSIDSARYEQLNQSLERVREGYRKAADGSAAAERAAAEAAASAIRERDALAALCDRLDPTSAGLRRVAEDQARLQAALAAGQIEASQADVLNQTLGRQADQYRKVAAGAAISFQNQEVLRSGVINFGQSVMAGLPVGESLLVQTTQMAPAFGELGTSLGVTRQALLGTVLPIATVTGAVLAGIAAWSAYSDRQREVEVQSRLMGGASGLTPAGLEGRAVGLAATADISAGTATHLQSGYLGAGLDPTLWERLTAVAKDYAAAIDTDVVSAGRDLATSFADPTKAAADLTAKYNLLSSAELDNIRHLQSSGQVTDAQAILVDKLGARVKGLADNTSLLGKGWDYVSTAAGNAFNAIGKAVDRQINGRPIEERLEGARSELANARAAASYVGYDLSGLGGGGGADTGRLTAAEAEVKHLSALNMELQQRAQGGRRAADASRSSREADAVASQTPTDAAAAQRLTDEITTLQTGAATGQMAPSLQADTQIARRQQQLTDYQAAIARGLSLEEDKRNQLAQAEVRAAAMVGPARETYLAQERARIDVLGSSLTAEERNRVKIDASSLAQASLTQAVTASNAQTSVATQGQLGIADAYQRSAAAGTLAAARTQAATDALSMAISVDGRAVQIIGQRAASEAAALAERLQGAQEDVKWQERIAAATTAGVAPRATAERASQVAKDTHQALTLAQAAETLGLGDLSERLRNLAASYDATSRAAASAGADQGLANIVQAQRDQLDALQRQQRLVGASADDQTRLNAAFETEGQIRQATKGIEGAITNAQQEQITTLRARSAQIAEGTVQVEHQKASWAALGDIITNDIQKPLEDAVDTILRGKGETIKWGNVFESMLRSSAGDLFKMGTINPIRNALGLGSYQPTLADSFAGRSGGTGSGATGVGTETSGVGASAAAARSGNNGNLSAAISNAYAGSWLQGIFGGGSEASQSGHHVYDSLIDPADVGTPLQSNALSSNSMWSQGATYGVISTGAALVGGALGGSSGRYVQSAASGAATGSAFGPWGAVAGAAIGNETAIWTNPRLSGSGSAMTSVLQAHTGGMSELLFPDLFETSGRVPQSAAMLRVRDGHFYSLGSWDNDGDPSSWLSALDPVITNLNTLVDTYHAAISPSVANLGIGTHNYQTTDELIAALLSSRAITAPGTAGVVLANSQATTLTGLQTDLATGSAYDTYLTPDATRNVDTSIRTVVDGFRTLRDAAEPLGLAIGDLTAAANRNLQATTADALENLVNPAGAATAQLVRQRDATIAYAQSAGLATNAISALMDIQIQRSREQEALTRDQAAATLQSLEAQNQGDTIRQTMIEFDIAAEQRLAGVRHDGVTDAARLERDLAVQRQSTLTAAIAQLTSPLTGYQAGSVQTGTSILPEGARVAALNNQLQASLNSARSGNAAAISTVGTAATALRAAAIQDYGAGPDRAAAVTSVDVTVAGLLDQLQTRLGGYALGGVSTSPELAWVSEGPYAVEAHVPMPDGSTIPLSGRLIGPANQTAGGNTDNLGPELAAIRAELSQMRRDNADLLRAIGATAEDVGGRTVNAIGALQREVNLDRLQRQVGV